MIRSNIPSHFVGIIMHSYIETAHFYTGTPSCDIDYIELGSVNVRAGVA